jgi:diguanylate cyclase (GGDEF)-like protein
VTGAMPMGRDFHESGSTAPPARRSRTRSAGDGPGTRTGGAGRATYGRADGSASVRPEGPVGDGHPAAVVVDSIPLPALALEAGSRAVAVNAAWSGLVGSGPRGSLGRAWVDQVDRRDRTHIRQQLEAAARSDRPGMSECRVIGPAGPRWTRWWWAQSAAGSLVVCVADVDDEREREMSLWHRATHDPLTGLLNRTELIDLTERALHRRASEVSSVALVYVDLDGFKAVNDGWGHHVGDGVLRAAAGRMAAALRPSDVLARVGGDEFAVLCDAVRAPQDAAAVAERIRQAVNQPVEVQGVATRLTASTGVALAGPGDTAESLLARADESMYVAKRDGGPGPVKLRSWPPQVSDDPRGPRPAPGPSGAVGVAPGGAQDGPEDRLFLDAMASLATAERLLGEHWRAALTDDGVSADERDRVVRAARLTDAALRALRPGTLA